MEAHIIEEFVDVQPNDLIEKDYGNDQFYDDLSGLKDAQVYEQEGQEGRAV